MTKHLHNTRGQDYLHRIRHHSADDEFPWGIVFDAETTMEGSDKDPAPHGPKGASVILWAVKVVGAAKAEVFTKAKGWFNAHISRFPNEGLMVAHNIKFDWQHLSKELGWRTHLERRQRRLMFWDTMVAEYILSAQMSKFASLGEAATKYGIGVKRDLVQEYVDKGLTTSDIPFPDLAVYAQNDVDLTLRVAKAQWTAATLPQRRLIMVHSAMAVMFAEAESTGFTIDPGMAVTRRDFELRRASAVDEMFKTLMVEHVLSNHPMTVIRDHLVRAAADEFTTPRGMSMVMFGLPTSIKIKAPTSRPTATRKWDHREVALSPEWPVLSPTKYGASRHSDGKSYTLDDKVLTAIKNDPEGAGPHADLADAILSGREASKKGVTYYQGLLERRERYGDSRIHHTMHVTSTTTGRTSSANPNAQNQPEEVREIFLPDQSDHILVEFDFKQLEVVALAVVSGDAVLMEDLNGGVDLHYEVGKDAGLWTSPAGMDKDGRRRVKSVNFGLIYGGGANTLAEQSGLPVHTVKSIIAAFYRRYPGVEEYHKEAVKAVSEGWPAGFAGTFVRDEVVASTGGTKRWRVMKAPATVATGRSYAFPELDDTRVPPALAPFKRSSAYSPTNIKNYYVQGFATGDLVPVALVMLSMDLPVEAQFLVAVHDSGLSSVGPESLAAVDSVLEELPTNVTEGLRILWGIILPVRLEVNVEHKERWGAKPLKTYTAKAA